MISFASAAKAFRVLFNRNGGEPDFAQSAGCLVNATTGTIGAYVNSSGVVCNAAGTPYDTGNSFTAPVIAGGLTASGSAANTFAGSTGTFITSTGANTLSGTTTVAANKNLLCATGTTLVDFSLGTGIFKTTTGAGTFGNSSNTFTNALTMGTASQGLVLKQGANGLCGTFVANGVTPVTVSSSAIATTDAIIISLNTVGGTVGVQPHVATITAATSFTVVCTASDTSTYNWAIVKNAA